MRSWKINSERFLDDLKQLVSFGALPEGGIDRKAFSPAYADAAAWLVARIAEAGLRTRIDAAGNVIGRLGPDDRPALPGGGALDGSLGVVAGLECARILVETGAVLEKSLEVIAFADEEALTRACSDRAP